MNKEQAVTTTDTLKLYAALHADVPETRPKHEERGPLVIYDDTYGNWFPCWENEFMDERGPYANEAIALCRCAALEWAAENTQSGVRLADWLLVGKAKSDRNLIDICRAIHAAKGANRD